MAVAAQPNVAHGLGIPADPEEGAPHGVRASVDVDEALERPDRLRGSSETQFRPLVTITTVQWTLVSGQ
jgi:hypothetical protein